MNRRAFFGAFGVLLAAPAAALGMKFAPAELLELTDANYRAVRERDAFRVNDLVYWDGRAWRLVKSNSVAYRIGVWDGRRVITHGSARVNVLEHSAVLL